MHSTEWFGLASVAMAAFALLLSEYWRQANKKHKTGMPSDLEKAAQLAAYMDRLKIQVVMLSLCSGIVGGLSLHYATASPTGFMVARLGGVATAAAVVAGTKLFAKVPWKEMFGRMSVWNCLMIWATGFAAGLMFMTALAAFIDPQFRSKLIQALSK